MSQRFFDEVLNANGSWTPPDTYPSIEDAEWKRAFTSAADAQRRDIANAWCWRFAETTQGKTDFVKMQAVVEHYQWLRDIKLYVTQYKESLPSPYGVISAYMTTKDANLPMKAVDNVLELMRTLWFGDVAKRANAIHSLVTALGGRASRQRVPGKVLMDLAQNLTWDAINEVSDPDPLLLANAARISILAGQVLDLRNAHHDPRAIAWHSVTQAALSNDKAILQARKVDAIHTINNMHPVTAMDGAMMLLYQVGEDSMTNPQGKIVRPTILVPPHVQHPQTYDVLTLLVPSRKGLWATAQALDMPVRESVKQVYAELKTAKLAEVDIPNDFSV